MSYDQTNGIVWVLEKPAARCKRCRSAKVKTDDTGGVYHCGNCGWTRGATTMVRAIPKVGRNAPCSCGSGRKFKRCCGGTG